MCRCCHQEFKRGFVVGAVHARDPVVGTLRPVVGKEGAVPKLVFRNDQAIIRYALVTNAEKECISRCAVDQGYDKLVVFLRKRAGAHLANPFHLRDLHASSAVVRLCQVKLNGPGAVGNCFYFRYAGNGVVVIIQFEPKPVMNDIHVLCKGRS